jgi:hypothetical protein
MTLDIEAAYQRGLAALTESRTDSDPHIGTHLAGACDRESWAKRKAALGELVIKAVEDPDVQTGFWLGHEVEAGLLDRIEAGLEPGFTMTRNLFCNLGGLIGHIDAVILDTNHDAVLVIDTKSTVWFNKNERGKQVWYPKPPKETQALQVAAYAIAIGCPAAGLYELDLGGKNRQWIPVDPEQYRAEVERRIVEVLERTDPAKPEPDVMPNYGATWPCGSIRKDRDGNLVIKKAYCAYTACPHHVDNALVTL